MKNAALVPVAGGKHPFCAGRGGQTCGMPKPHQLSRLARKTCDSPVLLFSRSGFAIASGRYGTEERRRVLLRGSGSSPFSGFEAGFECGNAGWVFTFGLHFAHGGRDQFIKCSPHLVVRFGRPLYHHVRVARSPVLVRFAHERFSLLHQLGKHIRWPIDFDATALQFAKYLKEPQGDPRAGHELAFSKHLSHHGAVFGSREGNSKALQAEVTGTFPCNGSLKAVCDFGIQAAPGKRRLRFQSGAKLRSHSQRVRRLLFWFHPPIIDSF